MDPVDTNATYLTEQTLATLAEIGEEINASLDLEKVLAKTATLIKQLADTVAAHEGTLAAIARSRPTPVGPSEATPAGALADPATALDAIAADSTPVATDPAPAAIPWRTTLIV